MRPICKICKLLGVGVAALTLAAAPAYAMDLTKTKSTASSGEFKDAGHVQDETLPATLPYDLEYGLEICGPQACIVKAPFPDAAACHRAELFMRAAPHLTARCIVKRTPAWEVPQ